MPAEETKIAVLENEMKHLNLNMEALGGKIDSLHTKLDDNYVKKSEFKDFYEKEFQPAKATIDKINFFYIKVIAVAGAVASAMVYLPTILKAIAAGIGK